MLKSDLLTMFFKEEELKQGTYHICFDSHQLTSIMDSWNNIHDGRPIIQLRDKKPPTQPSSQPSAQPPTQPSCPQPSLAENTTTNDCVLTIFPPIAPHQFKWLYSVLNLPNAQVIIK